MSDNNSTGQSPDLKRAFLGNTHFSVLARVAMQLGRESISNSIIAISELVKNAYDADAENVIIRFSRLDSINNKRRRSAYRSYRFMPSNINKRRTGKRNYYRFRRAVLIIEDDGNGMTEEQLRNQWMVIGTPNKAEAVQSSKKKRVLTGEKGLGRLGLDRLCEYAVLRTFARDEAEGVELLIDWRKYENTSNRLEDIEHALYSIGRPIIDPISGKFVNIPHGTQIILHNLKDDWTESFLLQLRKELTLLVSPFAGESDFGVDLDSGLQLKSVDGKIGSSFMLEAAEWHVNAVITEQGQIQYTMRSSEFPDVFELPLVPWNERFPGRLSPRCGPLSFDMYFYPRKAVELKNMRFSRAQIASFLDQNQGIRIYRDGFRVKPYGEPNGEGDWLTLSYRRQQSPGGVTQDGWRVGYNQVVGAVFISRAANMSLIDQTNREGLVEGPPFNDLRTFVGCDQNVWIAHG